METSIVKKNPFKLFQPNAMTTAIVPYSAIGKDVMYFIIDELQKYQRHEKEPIKDLFGDVVITLNVADIAKDNHYKRVWDAIKNELMAKPIKYQFYNERGKLCYAQTVVIPHIERTENYATITFRLPPLCYSLLLELWRGFTAYNKVVALSLSSMYSKKLYELCCRWADTGFYVVTIEEFKRIMNCEKKYETIKDLRNRVIESSIADINNQSEFEVSYSTVSRKMQEGVGRKKVTQIMFFIKNKTQSDKEYYWEYYRFVYEFLSGVYAGDTSMAIANWLMKEKKVVVANKRFCALRNDVTSGTVKKAGLHNYLLTILEEEYNVPKTLLPVKKEKTGKKGRIVNNRSTNTTDAQSIGSIINKLMKNDISTRHS